MQTDSRKIKKDSLLDRWLNRDKDRDVPKTVEPRPEGVEIPLSPGQQRLLFLQQLYPENPFYNYADSYRFKGRLDVDRLIRSFQLVTDRHAILRTAFPVVDERAIQKIREKAGFEIFRHDLGDLPPAERIEKAGELAVAVAGKPFDLSEGSLMRISVLRMSEDDHLIVLTMHHIIFDKWSMGVLLREVAEYYRALSAGEQIDLSFPEIQYADYAYWKSRQKTDPESLSYWKKKLENSPELLNLPADFKRPQQPTFRGAYLTEEFPNGLSGKLKALCKQTNTTLYVLLLTVYKILLNRYTGETDILVGSPFTNRDQIALEKLIGFFNDTLVLRSDLSEDPTFLELLEKVRQTTQEAFAHKNMPFETLVKKLKPDRYLNYNPLFQVMFIYHDVPKMPYFGADLSVAHEPFDLGVAKFDLTLYISEKDGRISATFEYSKDLFAEKTIRRMHGHLVNLLKGIVEDPDQKVSEIPMITDEELDLISKWNDTSQSRPAADSVLELFERQVRTNPEGTAISFQDEELTYEQLNKRINSVANHLVELGLDRKTPVGLFIEPSPEMIVGIFGILKAGLAYLPLDTAYPNERIEFILRDSSASLVLTQKHLLGKFPAGRLRVQAIGEIETAEDTAVPSLPEKIGNDDPAYVIYTSGSTGRPKGVSVAHENLLYSTAARFDYYPDQPESFLLLSSFSFDSSVVGIFWTLLTGGKLVLTERRIEHDLDRLAEIFSGEKITHTLLLPTLYSVLLENIPESKFNHLKTIIVAGEACSATLCRAHFEKLPRVELYNEYGPTEATVWATAHRLEPVDAEKGVPIGKPVPNTQIYILDEKQNQVPPGVTGELFIGGKGVTNGYLNDPELTEKLFLPNPFGKSESDKIYRTGDLCSYRSDGTIEFRGRKDGQVKIRGYRIELGEIGETLKQNPSVREAVVKLERIGQDKSDSGGSGDKESQPRLVAYLTGDNIPEIQSLRSFLKNKLPNYMIPDHFVRLESFPKLPNGKIDTDSLVSKESLSTVSESSYTAPKGETEKRLVKIWEEVLDVKPVGIHDNFFEIGGDSILSIRVVSKARKAGISLAPNQLFEHPTISGLALSAGFEGNDKTKQMIVGKMPLLPIQHWFFDEHKNAPHHWNQGIIFETNGDLDSDLLEKSVEHLTVYHDILRARFTGDGGLWKASLAGPESVKPFRKFDLSNLAINEIEPFIKKKSAEIQANLDLGTSDLFQVLLFECGRENKDKIVIFAHHLIVDVVSWRILIEDLETIYSHLNTGKGLSPSLPAKTTSYKKWSEHLKALAVSGAFDDELEFWQAQLDSSGDLPTDFETKTFVTEKTIESIETEIDPEITRNLLKDANEPFRTKPLELMITALMRAFDRWAGIKSLPVGFEKHGRNQNEDNIDLSNTVGWFTTYFPVRLGIEDASDLGANIVDIKEKLRMVPNEGLGFGVLRYLKEENTLNRKPLVIFNYLGHQKSLDSEVFGEGGFLNETVRSPESESYHLLETNVLVKDGRLKARFSFSKKIYRTETIGKLAGFFEDEIKRIVEYCRERETSDYTPSDFPESELSQEDLNSLLNQLS